MEMPWREYRLGSLDLTSYPYSVTFDFDLGAPPGVGSDETRVLSGTVLVEGDTIADIDLNAAALLNELRKARNEFAVYRSDFSAWSVFDVGDCTATLLPGDEAEAISLIQQWNISLPCLDPHTREADLTVTPALDIPVGSPTVVTIMDGTSLTGVTASASVSGIPDGTSLTGVTTLSVASSHVRVETSWPVSTVGSTRNGVLTFQGAYAVSPAATPYITVRVKPQGVGAFYPLSFYGTYSARFDGEHLAAMSAKVDGDYVEVTFLRTAAFSQIAVERPFNNLAPFVLIGTPIYFEIDSITMSSHPPTTGKQIERIVTVGGSADTQGSVAINGDATALNDVLVMTWPLSVGEGYSPPMMQYWVSGVARSASGSSYSGSAGSIATPSVFNVPASALPVAEAGDECAVWARLDVEGSLNRTVTFTVSAQAYMGATPVGTPIAETVVFDVLGLETHFVPICQLPPSPVPIGPDGHVEFTITGTSTATVNLQDWYLGPPGGAITAVNDLTTTRLWIDAPSLDQPYGGVWAGDAIDRSDAYSVQGAAASWETHTFSPQGMGMFTAYAADDAEVSLTHYRRHHTYVAAES